MGYSSGGSLAYCLDEARAISELLTKNPVIGQCQLYLEEEAQHQRFEAEAGERQLIHLATHAQFRQDDPLFSALLLAGGELTAQDLFNSELKASLVTFSACETGLGALSGGDELLGLSRACLYAGASSLLLSLWRVEDQSVAELMKTFYSQLLAGKRKGTALRQAQLTLLQTETYRHPFFWAPFILIGHPGLL
jgi:CHAT domain-containing protein